MHRMGILKQNEVVKSTLSCSILAVFSASSWLMALACLGTRVSLPGRGAVSEHSRAVEARHQCGLRGDWSGAGWGNRKGRLSWLEVAPSLPEALRQLRALLVTSVSCRSGLEPGRLWVSGPVGYCGGYPPACYAWTNHPVERTTKGMASSPANDHHRLTNDPIHRPFQLLACNSEAASPQSPSGDDG
jgi:hypothetical protein